MSCNSQQHQASLGEPTSSVVDSSSPEKEQELIVNTIEQWSSQSHALESPSYISSASSTTGATTPFTHQTIPMDTINHNIPTRKNSDDFMNMPPVHPFFNQPFVYDSDGSDGSLVLSVKPSKKNKRQQSSKKGETGGRDRFPSFDSVQSSGSVRYVSSSNASPVRQPQQSPQPINPHMLPYHERRKLLQQRQQQRSKQQQQQPPLPQQARGGDPRLLQQQQQQFAMMMMQQQQQQQQPYFVDPMAAAAYHGMYGMPVPGFHPGFPPPPPPPPGHFSTPQQGFPPPQPPYVPHLGGYPPPPFHYPPPPPNQLQQQQQNQQPPSISSQLPPQQQAQQQQRLSPYRTIGKQERPPKGNNSKNAAKSTVEKSPRPPISVKRTIARPPLSSGDSSDTSPPKSKQVRRYDRTNDLPPPPPPASQYHVRTDSFGSMSSLEGVGVGNDRDGVRDGTTGGAARGHTRTLSSGSGFLEMLRSWSPTNQPESGKANVSDFHRNNQEFLSRYNQNRPVAARISPKQNQHRRVNSQDRPPASRGTHKRLQSITNDDWEDNKNKEQSNPEPATTASGESNSSVDADDEAIEANERSSLLPPSGISTNEKDGNNRRGGSGRRRKDYRSSSATKQTTDEMGSTARIDDRTAGGMMAQAAKAARKHRKKKKSRRKSNRQLSSNNQYSSDSSDSSYDYRKWTQKRARMLEKERANLLEQWKAEARAEASHSRREQETNQWSRRIASSFHDELRKFQNLTYRAFTYMEAFIANLPLTIGAIALAIVTLGVVWFKFSEETLKSCEPVHFHSSQCTFPEFPGCFYCDTTNRLYQAAIYFHYCCNVAAGLLAMSFVAKLLIAPRVVFDEMSSPTTASPAGLLCMTTVCVFAGRGLIGQIVVTAAASVHLSIVIWYIYMALAYHIMPEPSWFPNTVGVGLSAVKTWLYYPMPGHLLMAISLSLNFFFFPISLLRVAINEKISATVGWMQMSAPAISLYALTIMAQPSFEEEHPDVTRFQRMHRKIYLPCMHVMAALSIIGFLASIHSLWTRWHDFKKREFSPAHAAFCFPLLSHVNAIQAYRGAIISFSDIHPRAWRMVFLYTYWFILLVGGTFATFWITGKFLYYLPAWTNLDVDDEDEPPAPYETIMSMQDMVTAGESLKQSFVSPAVLQANETGALVLARSAADGRLRYVRTRRLTALGFEPIMNWSEMQQEREVLLEWATKNPPKRRHRTLSVPGINFSYGTNLGTGNSGVYSALGPPRRRADTGSPRAFY